MKNVVISEFMTETALNGFGRGFAVNYNPELVNDRERLLKALKNAHGLIVRNRTQVNLDLLHAAPDLQVIGRLGVGLDNIDLQVCRARNVKVCPATGANTNAVVEYVITAAMTLRRSTFFATPFMLMGSWPRHLLNNGREIAGSTMGFFGFGKIAQTVAEKARSLGMNTIAYDPFLAPNDKGWSKAKRVKKERLFLESDIVSVHVPLTDETKNLVDKNMFQLMKRDAVFINTARGGVVNEMDLAHMLKTHSTFSAALDVFEDEPLTQKNAVIFKDCHNLILTPHIAGLSVEANQRVSEVTVENVKKTLKGTWF